MTSDDDRLRDLADRCVVCGLCAPGCPTYRLNRTESDSPRGRVLIAKAILDGGVADDSARLHLDRCLGCRNCESACPNGVAVTEIISGIRPRLKTNRDSFLLRQLRKRAENPSSLSATRKMLKTANFFRPAAAKILPKKMADFFRDLPTADAEFSIAQFQSEKNQKNDGEEIGFFAGCFARIIDAPTLHSAVKILSACGFRLRIPLMQNCCGALSHDAGDSDSFARLRMRNLSAFAGDFPIVHCASGCAATLARYGGEFSARIKDASELAARRISKIKINSLDASAVLHIPCTQKNCGDNGDSAREILRAIPQLRFSELAENDQCCGAAGNYFLAESQIARRLRAQKIAHIHSAKADYVVTANPGCAQFLAAGLRESGRRVKIVHPLSLLAKAAVFSESPQWTN